MLAATALFTTCLAGTSEARAAEAPLAVAYNELELTADLGRFPSWWMGGYGWGPRGCHSPGDIGRHLKAHCMVIHDNGVPNVLLRLDIVSLPRDVHEEIRRRVVDEAKLVQAEDFMIVTSHTHHGLFIGDTHPDPVLLMSINDADVDAINDTTFVLMDMLVDLVRMTVEETPIPATLWYDEGYEEIGHNRAGLEHVLNDVPVLLARNADDGTPLAVLFGFACHPVSRGRDNIIDSDYSGLAADLIAERLGIMALFFQGCAGDQDPGVGTDHTTQGDAYLAEYGNKLATTVIEVIERDQFTQVTGPFNNAMTEVDLLFSRDLTNPREVAALAERYEERLNDPDTEEHGKRHARLILDQIENGTLPTSIPMPIQRWRLGGLTILGLSHEVLSTFHVMLKDVAEQLDIGHLWIMAYVGETQCYVAADDKMRMGGYEAGWTDTDDIANPSSYCVSYGWPLPLRFSDEGVDPAAPDSTEGIVMKACTALLQP